MQIYIKIMNLVGVSNIFGDDNAEIVEVNGDKVDVDAREFVGQMSLVLSSWKEKYINNLILDGEEYRVKIVNDEGEERMLYGKNAFPENYGEFKKLIGEVLEKWKSE